MPIARIRGVRLAGIASAVPAKARPVSEFADRYGGDEVQRITRSTGVERCHISDGSLCTSDLCFAAARRLLGDLNWDPASVEAMVFVSQTFDFPSIPATSCVLQMRLGLPPTCAAFDVALGCSGHVYGLWITASLMAASGFSRVLLLAGDTISRFCSPLDRSTALLFGDAGSATALEKDPTVSDLVFSLGTDGTGWKNLIVPAGGFRRPRDRTSATRQKAEGDNVRSAEDLFMNGAEVFAFTLREVPPLIADLLATTGWNREEVDHFVFHQANRFMLQHLAKFMKLPPAKVPLSLQDYGNTSSASIPLTINAKVAAALRSRRLRLLLAGFGVGYSWAGCCLDCGPAVAPEVILVEESEAWQC
jgi:3-oxoacyl-[acyl-carrier-protein] synthase III